MLTLYYMCRCWPLAWVPCLMSDLQDSVHHCPQCGAVLGVDKAAGF